MTEPAALEESPLQTLLAPGGPFAHLDNLPDPDDDVDVGDSVPHEAEEGFGSPVQATSEEGTSKLVLFRQNSWTVSTTDGPDGVDQNAEPNVLSVTEYRRKLPTDSGGPATQSVRVITQAPSSDDNCHGENDQGRVVGGVQEMQFDDMPATEQAPVTVSESLPLQEGNNTGAAKMVTGQRKKSWKVKIVEDPESLGNNVAEHVSFPFRKNVYYTPCWDNKFPH